MLIISRNKNENDPELAEWIGHAMSRKAEIYFSLSDVLNAKSKVK